ncbi:hypothetical protein [Acidovorax sp. SUPP3334]|uniref:hypothetical protein n=1 Tax=Acidovorax sp. SUPP3334 TaxID=2920881 RepID=UPI0023DE3761|nr:hypothetical protein [Acidovorax sp. SUPP3334]GKT26966.1 hypothetical protein AVHM3334_22510 [Acidovorax sp. SUPP3334]
MALTFLKALLTGVAGPGALGFDLVFSEDIHESQSRLRKRPFGNQLDLYAPWFPMDLIDQLHCLDVLLLQNDAILGMELHKTRCVRRRAG